MTARRDCCLCFVMCFGVSASVSAFRRGDQLTSRCSPRQAKDTSVNCRGAAELHATLTRALREMQPAREPRRVAYIATNEPQNSSELE